MTDQKRADDGDPACGKRRKWCSRQSGRGFSILGWSETVWTEHLIKTRNRSRQLRHRARVRTRRSPICLNKQQKRFMLETRTLRDQSQIFCSGASSDLRRSLNPGAWSVSTLDLLSVNQLQPFITYGSSFQNIKQMINMR